MTAAVLAVVVLVAVLVMPGLSRSDDTSSDASATSPADGYPIHRGIVATVFWVGEDADVVENDSIHNHSSAWNDDWVEVFGGVDDPENRCGHDPCGFTPKENPFYFALPFSDYQESGVKPAETLERVYWYETQPAAGTSILKNRWIRVTHNDKTVYAQWADVGPFNEGDVDYVFGGAKPEEKRAGLDLSPAAADYLGLDGRGTVSWQFVDEAQVGTGPWSDVITTSDPDWQ